MDKDLITYRWNAYSQFGEDGILHKLVDDLYKPEHVGFCVECGAWDGLQYSNTFTFYSQGWGSLQIEGDPAKFNMLKLAVAPYPDVIAFNMFVDPAGANNMDSVLEAYGVKHVDLMVLDIDGDEHRMFKNLYTAPDILMVEVNPTFPCNVEFEQRPGQRVGSSVLSMCLLAARKYYKLVCYNAINCIFLRKDLYERVNYPHKSYLELLALGNMEALHASKDYDGNCFMYGKWDMSGVLVKPITQLQEMAERFVVHTGLEFMELIQEIDS